MMTSTMTAAAVNDAELVGQSLAGNRDAFGLIVARYQSLICSLAYSATGSLSQSEDLAQETFVAAWKQLPTLREPEKLRPWLCRISRNLTYDALREQGREPSHQGESLTELAESPSSAPLPTEQTISNEEAAILWRSLEKVPEIYREPLVLFYREHQSIETVAENLELTEDAVKQRLSRGRKLLHEQILGFVEGALAKTSPGKTFTLGVLAALPLGMTSAKAATLGMAIAKGGAGAKTAATAWSLGGAFVMIGASYLSLKARADDAKSPRERRFMLQMVGVRCVVSLLIYFSMFAAYFTAQKHHLTGNPLVTDIFLAVILFTSALLAIYFLEYTSRRQRQIQVEDGTWVAAEWNVSRKEATRNSPPTNQSKLNNYVRSLRFKAFIAMFIAMALMQKLWNLHLSEAAPMLAVWTLCLFLDFKNWQNSPRYSFRGTYSPMAVMIVAGFMTLVIINQNQYIAQFLSLLHQPKPPIPTHTLMLLNVIVVLVYATGIGILFRKHRQSQRALTAK
ncbi:MAG TPA: RNA polymerase sigma factor [Verrucomicrobiae bacterium]|jgi:RNA polymerase sigma factor (sigma-70 family)